MRLPSRRTVYISLGSFIVIAAVIIFVVHYINQPVEGQVSNNLSPIASSVPAFNANPVHVSGSYISFNHPAALSVSEVSGAQGAQLASYSYKYKDIETWVLAVSVNKLPRASLALDSNYSLRKQDPARYQASSRLINGRTYYIYSDLSAPGFASAAFSLNGNLSADISLYGDDQNGVGNLVATFNTVLNSFRWQ